MDALVESPEKVQQTVPASAHEKMLFRWQKYIDGDGRLFVVTNLYGFDENKRWGANVELLNVDREETVDYPKKEVMDWIGNGTLKRVEGSIII